MKVSIAGSGMRLKRLVAGSHLGKLKIKNDNAHRYI